MAASTRVSLVLLIYLLLGGILFAIPIFVLILKNIPYRFELLAGFYVSLFFSNVIKNFMLGGGLDFRLSTQVNDMYGARLQGRAGRFVDLQCMSLLRVFGVWLVFPAAWSSRIFPQTDLFHAYGLSLDAWLDTSSAPSHDEKKRSTP